jgi:glyoxylase-like metal-dependent hydrolase (beta-lactamase superfamily II)
MQLERDAAPGIHRIEDDYTNWFLVEDGEELTIVDAGVPRSWDSLHEALGQLGRSAAAIKALVLTHAHFDHIGFAERLRRELGVPVLVHENDVPLTRHPRQYARERSPLRYVATQPRALPIVASFLRDRAFWPRAISEVTRFTTGTLDVPGRPEIVPTPGHTLGHVSLSFPERDAVIAGDAVVMLNPYTGGPGPRIVAGAATADSRRALESLDALEALEAQTVLTGHGPVWRDGTAAMVRAAREAGPS